MLHSYYTLSKEWQNVVLSKRRNSHSGAKQMQINLDSRATREAMLKMIIKFCDISNPSKEWTIYNKWTDFICEEFYQQGDEERLMSLPISNYMDRQRPNVPYLQVLKNIN